MTQEDKEYLAMLFKSELSPIKQRLASIDENAKETNKRVSELEDKTIPGLHERINRHKEQLSFITLLTKKPMYFILFIGLVAMAFMGLLADGAIIWKLINLFK